MWFRYDLSRDASSITAQDFQKLCTKAAVYYRTCRREEGTTINKCVSYLVPYSVLRRYNNRAKCCENEEERGEWREGGCGKEDVVEIDVRIVTSLQLPGHTDVTGKSFFTQRRLFDFKRYDIVRGLPSRYCDIDVF